MKTAKKLIPLRDCPIGLFMAGDTLCVKTEYGNDDAYIVWSGERFWGGAKTYDEIGNALVLPIDDSVVQKIEKRCKRRYEILKKRGERDAKDNMQ